MNYEKYTLSIYMKGIENPFVYEVDESIKNRFIEIKNISIGKEDHKYNIFFCFDTKNGISVAVSLKYIQYAYSLFNPDYKKLFPKFYKNLKEEDIHNSSLDESTEDNKTLSDTINLFFLNRSEVVKIDINEPENAFMLMDSIDNYPDFDEKFISVIDVDGEEVLINPEELILLELPKELYDEGFKQIIPDAEKGKE